MISLVKIINFKCFEDQLIEMGPLTLLSGINSMGKSTVIQSLLLLRQSFLQCSFRVKSLALNGDLVKIGKPLDALNLAATTDDIKFELLIDNEYQSIWTFRLNKEQDAFHIEGQPNNIGLLETNLLGNDFHYLCAERVGPRTSFKISGVEVEQLRQLGTTGELSAHFLSKFERDRIPIQELNHKNAKSLNLRDQVEAWLSEISPGVRLHVTQYPGMDIVSLQFSFESGSFVSDRYRATNVGFGITYSLPVILAILSSKPGAIAIIENPEAHLHPKGQAKMGELFALAAQHGIQVITETHSDHVLNGIRIAVHRKQVDPDKVKVHFFTRPDNQQKPKVISPVMDKNGRLDKWPDGFFDEWEKSLDTLLD